MEATTYDDVDDDRLASYLDAVAERLGYGGAHMASSTGTPLRTALAEDHDLETEHVDTFTRNWAGISGAREVRLFRYVDDDADRHIAEWTDRVAIDDYVTNSLVFAGEPTAADVRTAELADQVARHVRRGAVDPTYSCWECGTETHVLDAAGAADDTLPKLRSIVDAGEQRYCHRC